MNTAILHFSLKPPLVVLHAGLGREASPRAFEEGCLLGPWLLAPFTVPQEDRQP